MGIVLTGKARTHAISLLHEIDLFKVAIDLEKFHIEFERLNRELDVFGSEDEKVLLAIGGLKDRAKSEGYEFAPRKFDDFSSIAGFYTRIPLVEAQIPDAVILDQSVKGYVVGPKIPISRRVYANYMFSVSRGLHLLVKSGGFWDKYIDQNPASTAETSIATKRRPQKLGQRLKGMVKRVVPWGKQPTA